MLARPFFRELFLLCVAECSHLRLSVLLGRMVSYQGYAIVPGPWGDCSGPCGEQIRTRTLYCAGPTNARVDASFCEDLVRPSEYHSTPSLAPRHLVLFLLVLSYLSSPILFDEIWLQRPRFHLVGFPDCHETRYPGLPFANDRCRRNMRRLCRLLRTITVAIIFVGNYPLVPMFSNVRRGGSNSSCCLFKPLGFERDYHTGFSCHRLWDRHRPGRLFRCTEHGTRNIPMQ